MAAMPTVEVNGTRLYFELRGAGPPVLLVMGATGDAGHFEAFADLLADEFTVVSYDRRGNGRSPRPQGWTTTSPREQADDAAALLAALDLAPAAVYGSSSGANFALCLLLSHPELVCGAVLHEPVLVRLYDDPSAAAGAGPPADLERFWRRVAGAESWERLEPSLRARMLATASTFFTVEAGTFEHYLPDAASTRPCLVLVSEDGRPPAAQAAGRLAELLGTVVVRTPGSHVSYHDHPRELAATIRPFLRRISAPC